MELSLKELHLILAARQVGVINACMLEDGRRCTIWGLEIHRDRSPMLDIRADDGGCCCVHYRPKRCEWSSSWILPCIWYKASDLRPLLDCFLAPDVCSVIIRYLPIERES